MEEEAGPEGGSSLPGRTCRELMATDPSQGSLQDHLAPLNCSHFLSSHISSAVNLRDLTQGNASGNPTKSRDLTTLCSWFSTF